MATPRINFARMTSVAPSVLTHMSRSTGRRVVLVFVGIALILGIAIPAALIGSTSTPAAANATASAAAHQPAHKATSIAHTSAVHQAAASKPAPKAVHKAAAPKPSMKQLMPQGKPDSHQSSVKTSGSQMKNAKAIVEAGQKLHLQPRAWVIAVATSLQETKLHNLGSLGANNDHDSLGLFQQRPSSGWGSAKQIENPTYAATKFYKALKHVDGWQNLPLTEAAQKVQVSAFGDRYAQWENQAAHLVMASVN